MSSSVPAGIDYQELVQYVTAERLGSYLRASRDGIEGAFALYEWNMRAAASVVQLTSMVEVVVRNALDRELREWARRKHAEGSWFGAVSLDERGQKDLRLARERATERGRRPEIHGRVIAELSLGFWRYLVSKKYLTQLWIPASSRAFPGGSADLRNRQRDVERHMQQLHFVRNRAAHHEPIHQRDLHRDLRVALDLASWVAPITQTWIGATSTLPSVLGERPSPAAE